MRRIFCRLANVSADYSQQRSSTGSLFHTVGPFTAKLLAPIDVLVFGTNRIPVVADRSRCLPVSVDTGLQSTARYDGARPCRHFVDQQTDLVNNPLAANEVRVVLA